MDGSERRVARTAGWSLAVTALLAVAKFLVWAATGSLAVLSQALDSLLDIAALGIIYFGVRIASRPADQEHHYGHGKAEHLAAFAQTLFIGVVVVAIVVEAIGRLSDGRDVADVPWYALALLGASVIVDAVRAALMARVARAADSDAMRAGALNIAGDVGTALVALVSLMLVRADVAEADAVGALIVAIVVAILAISLGRRAVDVLMDRAPQARLQAISDAAASAPGVKETRRIRVRRSGGQLFADVTVAAGRTTSLERAHEISDEVERAIESAVPGTDVVVHVEPTAETSGLVERVLAAATRLEGVHEIHNVLVHAFDEAGRQKLHVTLHAKVRRGVSVAQAHDLSDRIEAEIEKELGSDVRVDTHIEPMDVTAFGKDVTEERVDVATAVRTAAQEEPDIIDCHEVIVTSTGGELSVVAHVRGRADLPLSRMHDAATRVENLLHATFEDLGSIVIHFEPD